MITPQYLTNPQHDVADRSRITRSIDITLISLSLIFVLTRIYVRKFVSNNLGLDDAAALVSFVRSLKTHLPVIAADWRMCAKGLSGRGRFDGASR